MYVYVNIRTGPYLLFCMIFSVRQAVNIRYIKNVFD